MIKFYAYTDQEIHNKQKIINFAEKFHKKHPTFTEATSQMSKDGKLPAVFRMLGVNKFRLIAEFDPYGQGATFYRQTSPKLTSVKAIKAWLKQKDVHICLGESGLPISFRTFWRKGVQMNRKAPGYALEPYPGTYQPRFHAKPSDYVISKKYAEQPRHEVVFTAHPGKPIQRASLITHVYVLSNRKAYKVAGQLWKDLRKQFGSDKAVTLPSDPATKTLLLQEFVKEYRLTFIKANDYTRPVVYVRSASAAPLDVGILESSDYRFEEWRDGYSPIGAQKLLRAFTNDALLQPGWFEDHRHKPALRIYDYGGNYVPHYRYLYDLRTPSFTKQGGHHILEFDIIPNTRPIVDTRTNEVLRPMPNSSQELKNEVHGKQI